MTNIYLYIFFDKKKIVSKCVMCDHPYDAEIAPVQGIHSVLCGRA